ncbi:MAG TPA: hypothetical protein VME21_04030, partial [Steroidobacteraceae bacterium]|nr:hypothetical protein [Steroidobacteraceae bacterium]
MTQSLSSILTGDLERGGTLVVPTPQRAAAVRLAYARQCLRAGKHSWRAPRVLPARGWLEAQAQRVLGRADSGLRAAEPAEEWWLWQRAAAQVLEQRAIPFTPTLVPALRRAARLLDEWQMPPAGLRSGGHAEAELLAAVLEEVEARCAARQCVPSHRFLSLVLRDSVPAEPASFAGFTELPAGWHTLIRGMSRGGPAEPEPGTPGEAFAVPAHDEIEELELAAEWCRRQLLADPARRLLVIVPALERRQAAVLRAFTQVLEPDAVLDTGRAAIGARLAIEGGVPLAQYPLVRAGLRSLRLLTGTLEAAELSAWLRDGFWETPGQAERARLDTWLRRTLPLEVSLESLTTRLAGAPPALAPVARALRGRLQRAAGMLRGASERPLGHWARPFAAALTELGWPGSRSLDSEEQQSQARWQLALLEWQGLGAPWGRARAATAAQALRRWLSSVAFAPASSDVPVTLSSQLADPIVRYDGIWVAGLQAETWPPPPRVEPFVPLALQRAAGMSALQPTLLLEQSRQLLARLRAATAQLMLSWATRSEG